MMTYLRIDESTGAMFAGNEVLEDQAVVSFFAAPRAEDDARGNGSAAMMAEWLSGLPSRIARVSAWASNDRDARFLSSIGFSDEDGRVGSDGCRGMVMLRQAA